MPNTKALKKKQQQEDEFAALGPRSRSGRLVWSQSSAQLDGGARSDEDDDDEGGGASGAPATPTAVVPLGKGGQSSSSTRAPAPAAPKSVPRETQRALAQRLADVRRHFPGALCADDLLSRVEYDLASRFGFSGRNAIAVCNLCRDEATAVLRDRIEEAWGGAFTTSGLGAVLTCGVTGFKAGLSHAPVCPDTGRERYVFFSFPHIAIDAAGHVGHISRPGRAQASHACGALLKVMGELKAEDEAAVRSAAAAALAEPGGAKGGGVGDGTGGSGGSGSGGSPHKPCASCGAAPPAANKAAEPATLRVCNLDPEYSILKGRIDARLAARRDELQAALAHGGDLVAVTKAAERAITADLERLVAAAVDTTRADYAVITGVEVHNWATDLSDPAGASLEMIFATEAYAVVKGRRFALDLSSPAPAGFSIGAPAGSAGSAAANKRAGGGGGGGGGGVAALAGRLAGLFGMRSSPGGGGGSGASVPAVNGSAATPKAISSGAMHDRLAPGAI